MMKLLRRTLVCALCAVIVVNLITVSAITAMKLSRGPAASAADVAAVSFTNLAVWFLAIALYAGSLVALIRKKTTAILYWAAGFVIDFGNYLTYHPMSGSVGTQTSADLIVFAIVLAVGSGIFVLRSMESDG